MASFTRWMDGPDRALCPLLWRGGQGDRLAAEGVRFTLAFATTASCGPSRGVIYTGLHAHASGQYGHAHGYHNFGLLPHVETAWCWRSQPFGSSSSCTLVTWSVARVIRSGSVLLRANPSVRAARSWAISSFFSEIA